MAEDDEKLKPIDFARQNMGFGPSRTRNSTVPPLLQDPEQRANLGLPEDPDTPGPYMVELNINYHAGWKEAANEFEKFYGLVIVRQLKAGRQCTFPRTTSGVRSAQMNGRS